MSSYSLVKMQHGVKGNSSLIMQHVGSWSRPTTSVGASIQCVDTGLHASCPEPERLSLYLCSFDPKAVVLGYTFALPPKQQWIFCLQHMWFELCPEISPPVTKFSPKEIERNIKRQVRWFVSLLEANNSHNPALNTDPKKHPNLWTICCLMAYATRLNIYRNILTNLPEMCKIYAMAVRELVFWLWEVACDVCKGMD